MTTRTEQLAVYANHEANVDSTTTTEATGVVELTAGAISCDGVTPYLFIVDFCAFGQSTTTADSYITLFEDGSPIGTLWRARDFLGILSSRDGTRVKWRRTPTAGSHTYSVRLWVDAASTFRTGADTLGGGADMPFQFRTMRLAGPTGTHWTSTHSTIVPRVEPFTVSPPGVVS